MENVNNTNGKCFHSSIHTSDNVEFIYTKAYKGDWGDWDDQPETIIADSAEYDEETIDCAPIQ